MKLRDSLSDRARRMAWSAAGVCAVLGVVSLWLASYASEVDAAKRSGQQPSAGVEDDCVRPETHAGLPSITKSELVQSVRSDEDVS